MWKDGYACYSHRNRRNKEPVRTVVEIIIILSKMFSDIPYGNIKHSLLEKNFDSIGSKAELKQRLVEHLEKEGEDLSIFEFEYNIEGREQTDNFGGTENTATAREKHSEEKGEDGASVSNAVIMQFMQQMRQQMQQQGQQIESKIDIVQENQRILQTHIDEMCQQFEGKVHVLEEKVDNAIGQLDAIINAQEKDVKNEIKALEKELAKLQTNDVTTSTIKVKILLFDGTTNSNAFKLQFGVVATKNMWDDDDKAVVLITSLRGAATEIIQIIPDGKRAEFAAIMVALERKYGSKRCQKLNERIQNYATEIERVYRCA
uniref:Uncharacterized protein n=1 Tax=Glossina austeni TaxID=7395 RepID=A0A1A9VJ38_GLOAU